MAHWEVQYLLQPSRLLLPLSLGLGTSLHWKAQSLSQLTKLKHLAHGPPWRLGFSRVFPTTCRALSMVWGAPLISGQFWGACPSCQEPSHQILCTHDQPPVQDPSGDPGGSSIFIPYCKESCQLCQLCCDSSRPDRFTGFGQTEEHMLSHWDI